MCGAHFVDEAATRCKEELERGYCTAFIWVYEQVIKNLSIVIKSLSLSFFVSSLRMFAVLCLVVLLRIDFANPFFAALNFILISHKFQKSSINTYCMHGKYVCLCARLWNFCSCEFLFDCFSVGIISLWLTVFFHLIHLYCSTNNWN